MHYLIDDDDDAIRIKYRHGRNFKWCAHLFHPSQNRWMKKEPRRRRRRWCLRYQMPTIPHLINWGQNHPRFVCPYQQHIFIKEANRFSIHPLLLPLHVLSLHSCTKEAAAVPRQRWRRIRAASFNFVFGCWKFRSAPSGAAFSGSPPPPRRSPLKLLHPLHSFRAGTAQLLNKWITHDMGTVKWLNRFRSSGIAWSGAKE